MAAGRYQVPLFIPTFALFALMDATSVAPAAGAERNPVVIYFFWGDGCSNCAAEKPVLEELERRFPEVDLRAYEVWFDEDNRQFFLDMAQAYGIEARGVPTTFIGDSVWIGFAEHLTGERRRKANVSVLLLCCGGAWYTRGIDRYVNP